MLEVVVVVLKTTLMPQVVLEEVEPEEVDLAVLMAIVVQQVRQTLVVVVVDNQIHLIIIELEPGVRG